MQTIEITDDLYSGLLKIAESLSAQDNRGTAAPYFYQIRDWEKTYDWGLDGDTLVFIDTDGTEIETVDELIDYLDNNGIAYPPEIAELFMSSVLWDWIDDNCPALSQSSYSLKPIYVNSFLTETAAKNHLNQNYYHYHKNADVYLAHAWRNPEAEVISNLLCGLVNKTS